MKCPRGGMPRVRCSSFSRLWLIVSLCLLVPAQTSDEDRWTTRQSDDFNKTDAILRLPDTLIKKDTNLTDSGWPFQFLISTDKRLFKSWNKQPDTSTQATSLRPSEHKDSTKRIKSSHFKSADHPNRLHLAERTGDFSKKKIYTFSTFPRRRKKLESTIVTQILRKNIKRPYQNRITSNKKYDRKDRVRRSSGTASYRGLTDTDSIVSLNGANTASRRDKNQDRRQTDGQENTRQSLKRRTERRTAWTEYNPNVDLGTAVEVEPAHENPKGDLVAEESLSAPIFVTIVQRNEEADYFTDKYPPYPPPPPPPKYHHKPEYYPPPPPPKYQTKPEYHPLPIPPYLPPPPIYHPVPDYHPPPSPRYHQDDAYHHFEVKAKYYHASDYNEPSYHKPKFFDESLYHHDIEYHPPVPPPLPLPKYKREYPSHPPVYHPKIHHEPKHQHSYLPPPPSPPKTIHKPDYYPDPEYHHHEVQYHHSAPTKYEYHLDIYDRKDNYEPHYQDHPKLPINHQASQPQAYLDKKEPIEEVKHEYRKGSRSFEHSVSHLAAVHVNGDNLYKDAPPHGFIKAKYETSAAYHPEPLYPPLPPPTSIYQRYNEAPLPLPPHPPASHHDIKLDNSPKTKHLLPVHPNPLPSPEPFHDVPLPAPLPSLEDVDPLIFEPIFSYNDYFDAATKIPVGDEFSFSVSSLLLPRDSPFNFNLNEENIYSSQSPKITRAFTNPPSSSILPTYESPTFTAKEEEEYFQHGLSYTPLTSAKPPLLPTTCSALPVTYSMSTSTVPASPSRAPEVPVTSSPLTSITSGSPLVSKETAKSTTVTSEVHVLQEQEIEKSPNDKMMNLAISEAIESLTAMTQPTQTTPRLKLILLPTDLTVTPRTITALLQSDNQITSDSLMASDSSERTENAISFTDALTDTSAKLADTTAELSTAQIFIADLNLRHQSTEPTVTPRVMMTPPQIDNPVIAESLVTENSFEMRDDIVLLTDALPDTTIEPSTMEGFITEPKPTRSVLKQKLQKTIVMYKENQTSISTFDQSVVTKSGHNSRDFLKLFYPNLNPTLSISVLSPNAISSNDRNKLAQFFLSNKKVSNSNGSTVLISEKGENFKSLNNISLPEKQRKSLDHTKKQPTIKQSSSNEQNLTISQFHKEPPSYPIAEDGFQPVLIPSKLTATKKATQTPTPNTYGLIYQSHTLPTNMNSTKQSPYNFPSSIYGSKSSSSSSTSSMYESNQTGYRSPGSIFGPSKSSKWLVTTREERILSLQRNSRTRDSSQNTGKKNWNLPVFFQL